MSVQSRSSLKVPYDLRPAKQVERRMLVDAFLRLAQAGFAIRDYQYTGFGSLYFIDFILFHKLLGINKMLTVEHDESLEDRVRFNRPFDCINVAMSSAADVIPILSRDVPHILWLDYDCPITRDVLADVYLSASQLCRGSILLVTVDVEPPVKGSEDPHDSMAYFAEEAGDYLGLRDIRDFTKTNIPRTSVTILQNVLNEGIVGRQGISFCPLFHFLYADGHLMLTVGGVIVGEAERRKIRSVDMDTAFYFRTDLSSGPYQIIIPRLTRKERHVIDSAMPCELGWQPNEFTLPEKAIEVYREVYRFLPAYAELLL
jgi:hypothetical protein